MSEEGVLELYLHLDGTDFYQKYKNFISSIVDNCIRIPPIESLKITMIPNKFYDLNKFYEKGFPVKVKYLDLRMGQLYRSGSSYYIKSLLKALTRATKQIYLSQFDLKKEDLENIVKASSKCSRLILDYANIDADKEFDFSGEEYNISLLSFKDADYDKRYNHWNDHPERFENIVLGIKNCNLKHSLTEIDLFNSGISLETAQILLEKHGLGHIKAVEKAWHNPVLM
jgi:hypothetical protein